MKIKPDFKDARGAITDLLVGKDYSFTHITFKKGAVRGNHYHRKTQQLDIVIKGEFNLFHQNGKGPRLFQTVKKGHQVQIEKGTSHAYKALKDSEMVSICFGKRVGKNYEKDTIRLKKPLI